MGDSSQGVDEDTYVQWMTDSVSNSGIGFDSFEQVFNVLDLDNHGALGMGDLKQALSAIGEEIPDELVSGILKVNITLGPALFVKADELCFCRVLSAC